MRLKNKPKTLGQFIIDLTPLLDVIFILLIVILTYQDDFGKKADEALLKAQEIEQQAKDDVAAAESSKNAVQEQLDTYENLYNSVNVVTIYASYVPSNRKYRTLHVQVNANDLWETEINPSNEERIWDECLNYIETEIAKKPGIPTIFSILDEQMLYRDEMSMLDLYDRLSIQDKYIKNNMETDNE